jgi:predicted nucleic acid-binding protein
LSPRKIVVDTDIFLDHLVNPVSPEMNSSPSMLRRAMAEFFCYTTVFNAIELFGLCETGEEVAVVEDVMHSLKILGLNGKSAKNIGALLVKSGVRTLSRAEALIAGVCVESQLPLLTSKPRRYTGFKLLRIVTPAEIFGASKKGTLWSSEK